MTILNEIARACEEHIEHNKLRTLKVKVPISKYEALVNELRPFLKRDKKYNPKSLTLHLSFGEMLISPYDGENVEVALG